MSPERARALNAWAATLTPQEATRARAIARNCGNCVHFEALSSDRQRGACVASEPRVMLRPDQVSTRGFSPVHMWPETAADMRCGRWNHPSLPLGYLSRLSPVELDQVASAMGVQIDG